MADNTKIEWTEATWNPITGCSVTSPGCTNCYAMQLAGTRLKHVASRKGLTQPSKAGPVWTGEVRFDKANLTQPLRWKRPRMIFVCAHGDLFHESVPDAWIDKVFAVMALCPQHTFQVLTKRSARMRDYVTGATCDGARRFHVQDAAFKIADWFNDDVAQWPLPNVWLGVSVEDQQRADERIPDLLATPAAIRWISAEPLLGPVDLTSIDISGDRFITPLEELRWENLVDQWRDTDEEWKEQFEDEYGRNPDTATGLILPKLDWVVVGGESGKDARPMHPDWARALRDQCATANVPFFFKQWGEWVPLSGPDGFWPHDKPSACRLMNDGTRHPRGKSMQRIGKKRAGRLLDGVEHNGMPEQIAFRANCSEVA